MEENGKDLENFKLNQEVQPSVTAARKREFKQIIVKCVLQLLMIETVSELLASDQVYEAMPSEQLLVMMQVLRKSYRFARKFNNNRELRMNLLRIGNVLFILHWLILLGFMKQLPNLLKQESSAAATYISILLRMYNDPREERVQSKYVVEEALIPYNSTFNLSHDLGCAWKLWKDMSIWMRNINSEILSPGDQHLSRFWMAL